MTFLILTPVFNHYREKRFFAILLIDMKPNCRILLQAQAFQKTVDILTADNNKLPQSKHLPFQKFPAFSKLLFGFHIYEPTERRFFHGYRSYCH